MIKEAVLHRCTEEYIYPVSRNQLTVRVQTATKDIKKCQIVYWNRTDPSKKNTQEMKLTEREEFLDHFQAKLTFPKVARYQKYYFIMEDVSGNTWYYTSWGISDEEPEDGYFEFLYANQKDVLEMQEWSKGTVYYQIFPERFYNGSKENDPANCEEWGTLPTRENYMGGDLQGIKEKVPYLKDLGIECLYLNPIFKGDFNHKYATTDYLEIDPIFGTKEDLTKLVKKCHENGIRILLDGVFNHTGIHFEPFQDVLKNGENSKYKDWFWITEFPPEITHHDYECVGAYKWMPKLNTANPGVREYVLKVMDYWIKACDIDGWRLDVADEVDATLWQSARVLLKDRYPDKILLGETWGDGGKLLRGNQMDSIMNYIFRDAVRDYFAKETIDAVHFDYRIGHMLSLYREETNQVLYNPLDSHDTERFLFFCQEDKRKMKLAVAFQMMFLGSPAIYYGDEIGLTGDNDPDCRRCMEWGEKKDTALYSWYQKLISLRKQSHAIRKGSYQTIVVDAEKRIFGFTRIWENEVVYVLLHNGAEKVEIECPLLEEKGTFENLLTKELYQSDKLREGSMFLNGDKIEYRSTTRVTMEPYSVKVISKLKEDN